MSKATAAKQLGKMAGQKLGGLFDIVAGGMGKIASSGTAAALRAGTDTFMPGIGQKQLPAFLRSSTSSVVPQTVGALAQIGTYGLGAYGLDNIFDQQSVYTQPMKGGTGNKGMDHFLASQQLQNQKFMNDMMLIQARAESRIPGAQYPGSLLNMTQKSDVLRDAAEAERIYTDAGEITNREVQAIGRMIYGTGLRA